MICNSLIIVGRTYLAHWLLERR